MKFFRSGITFNQTWEDFDVDKKILEIEKTDVLLSITSGGCNILNACLLEPKKIFAVDANPSQNHLLRLKIAAIQTLNYSEFWGLFGAGKSVQYRNLYFQKIRPALAKQSQIYWDKYIDIFGTSLFKIGSLGTLSILRVCLRRLCGEDRLIRFSQIKDLREQGQFYISEIEPRLWEKIPSFVPTFTMLAYGVHLRQIIFCYKAGKYYLKDLYKTRLHHLFTRIPMKSNYFWYFILFGRYRNNFECPDYLKESNFNALKRKVKLIDVVDADLVDFLKTQDKNSITKFSLSDVIEFSPQDRAFILWQEIIRTARKKSLISYRSFAPDILPPAELANFLFYLNKDSQLRSLEEKTASYSNVYKFEVRK